MRRAMHTLHAYPRSRRYDEGVKLRRLNRTKAADFLLFDQTLINLVLLEAITGRHIRLNSSENSLPIGIRDPAWRAAQKGNAQTQSAC